MSSRPLRLVVLESSAHMGGVQHSTFNLLKRLDRELWDPLLLCPEGGPLVEMLRAEGITVCIVPLPKMKSTSVWTSGIGRVPNPFAWVYNALALLRSAWRVTIQLRLSGASVMLTKGLQSHFIGGLAAWRIGVPCVWHLQDLLSERLGGINIAITALLARLFAHGIIADGQAIYDQYPEDLQHITRVILNGVDTAEFHPGKSPGVRLSLGLTDDSLIIGHAARITPWKGQMLLLEAFLKIAPVHPSAHLLFVGGALFDVEKYFEQLRQRASNCPFSERIHFTGYREDLSDCLRAMDIFIYPSLEKDTSPLALLSAMACGLPVVGFDIAGLREVVTHRCEVVLVPANDVDELARAMEELIVDGTSRLSFATAAREKAIRDFTVERFAEECELVLLDCLKNGKLNRKIVAR